MTFHVSGAVRVLNPYDWLPSSGESDLEFRSEGLNVIIDIFMPPNSGSSTRHKRELRFFGVSSFRKESFPGPVVPTGVSFDNVDISGLLGSLIEFERSDVADAWSAHFQGRHHIRHYVMHFLSEQVSIGVFATGYELGDETNV